MTTQGKTTVAVLLAVGFALTACRVEGDGSDASQDEGGVQTDVGVTSDPCPEAVNADNGCIYLGTISDLTEGPFAPLAVPIVAAQEAFWQRVNEEGGIGGYDIDVRTNVRDNKYNPEVHNQAYQEIKGEVLALAQTLGSPTTAAILDDMKASDVVAAPAAWTSAYEFEDVILESGTNYCFEAMNSVDWAVREFDAQTVMAVHYPGDYGGDAAAGVDAAAQALGIEYSGVETGQGTTNQGTAIQAILTQQPDVVFVTTGPGDAAAIIGQTAAGGFRGTFVGTSPTWNPALLESPAAPALKAAYFQSGPWAPFGGDTPGHEAMREALGEVTPSDGHTAGWIWSYPMKAALEAAVDNGDLTRAGLLEAVKGLETVDYEGMLPEAAGNYAGEPGEAAFRQSVISKVDEAAPTGVSVVEEFFASEAVEAYDFSGPCF
jgi:ABC-type branched-subunit amino acid transport system substrate-binding protein